MIYDFGLGAEVGVDEDSSSYVFLDETHSNFDLHNLSILSCILSFFTFELRTPPELPILNIH